MHNAMADRCREPSVELAAQECDDLVERRWDVPDVLNRQRFVNEDCSLYILRQQPGACADTFDLSSETPLQPVMRATANS